ncbi:MAG: dihydrolipoyl dehydrogenase [Candidatus Syntrophosphaera sp.]|nr:dihydrolipoyl dehydrogenase [Candidatus Syntrophosphaera sp.]
MSKYQVVIIGGGPGGYETAIRLNQYGIECAVIESGRIGGVCLNWGCIPTKALVKSAELLKELAEAESFGLPAVNIDLDYRKVFERKNAVVEQLVGGVEHLFRKRGIPIIHERAERVAHVDGGYLAKTSEGNKIWGQYLIVATGSVPKELPGVAIDEEKVLSSTGILGLEELPHSIAIVGGGVIGCEFASILNSFGVQTHIIEFLPRILSTEDEEIAKRLTLALKKAGIKISTGVGVESARQTEEGLELQLSDGKSLEVEKALLSVGRDPQSNLIWEDTAPQTERGAISIDAMMRSSLPNVYAIGDVTAKLPLAHTASKQGLIAAAHIRSLVSGSEFHHPTLDYANIPRCTFTKPEVASVGLSEAEASQKYGEIKIGKFPFSANGKALAMSDTFGFVKTIARADTSALVGMHIIGPHAAELIAQGAILISLGARADVAESVVFAHPTLSEAIKESLEDLSNLSINKI